MTPPSPDELLRFAAHLVLDRLQAFRAGDEVRLAALDVQAPRDQPTLAALYAAAFGIAERALSALDARDPGSATSVVDELRNEVTSRPGGTGLSDQADADPDTTSPRRTNDQEALGIRDAAGQVHLIRQLDTVGVINVLAHQLLDDPQRLVRTDTELGRLAAHSQPAPVGLVTSVRSGLTIAKLALNHIAVVLNQRLPVHPLVLQILTRAAMLGAGRVVFALGPDEPSDRDRNVAIIMQQEARSFEQCLRAMADFQHLVGLRPSDRELNRRLRQIAGLRAGQPTPAGEASVLKRMATVLGERVARGQPDATGGLLEPLREHIAFIWNVYSGVAHGYGWPSVYATDLARDRGMPDPPANSNPQAGDFLADFGMVVPIVHFAFDDALRSTDSQDRGVPLG